MIFSNDEFLRETVINAPIGICILDSATLISEIVNDKFLEVTDKPYEAVFGQFYWDAFAEARPYYEAALAGVIKNGAAYYADEVKIHRVRYGQPETVFVKFVYTPIKNNAGDVIKVAIWVMENTTKAIVRQSHTEKNAQLASIISSTEDTILSKTLQGIITSWNPAAERMFGYSESEAIGKHISLIIPPSRLNEEDFIISQVKAGKRVDHFETVRVAKDGHEVPISLTVSPIYDDQGKVTGASKIARDISERKKDELRKNDFIGMVSHELKTPLTSLIALIQLTKMQLSKKGESFLADAMVKAENQAKKMTKMINGFLNLSRLESGKISIENERFDIAGLLRELEQEIKMTYRGHQIIFDPLEEAFVYADAEKIGHVINNLISNAAKYSDSGSKIHIGCIRQDDKVVVRVHDEGIGISAKDTRYLFDRYYRVEDASTKYIAGFGIGLYLSAEIVARHNGKIWVESEPNVGSTFYFSLKLD